MTKKQFKQLPVNQQIARLEIAMDKSYPLFSKACDVRVMYFKYTNGFKRNRTPQWARKAINRYMSQYVRFNTLLHG